MSGVDVDLAQDRQDERAEVRWLLESGVLGQSTNLARMFRIVCDKYFENPEATLKEYTIAVEGLGRSQDFDPHIDPIVRVTAHLLRKRLKEFYAGEGAERAVHISLPLGRYTPQFTLHTSLAATQAEPDATPSLVPPLHEGYEKRGAFSRRFVHVVSTKSPIWIAAFIALLVIAGVGLHLFLPSAAKKQFQRLASSATPPVSIHAGMPFRMLVGAGRSAYTDQSGDLWEPDRYCEDGQSFTVAQREISGTEDPEIFLGGRRGMFHCVFPVAPGMYEAHLYFADTSGAADASQSVVYSFVGNPVMSIDVPDYALGPNAATERLVPDVKPGLDRKIHLDFMNSDSFVNAIELIPSKTSKLAPIRIAASDKRYVDAEGHIWLSDRFFTGGRRSLSKFGEGSAGNVQYESARVGHFIYSIPVVPGATYTVRLHFIETWFGNLEGSSGKGRRVFDVTCNGISLLKNFDVFAEGGDKPVVKTFSHIVPNGLGKIELEFTPVYNYAFVNGIEIIEE